MPDTIIDNEALLSPYLAAIEGRDAAAQQKFFERFAQQPQDIRHFIASPDTAAAIQILVDSDAVPMQYAVAVAKIVALAAMGEIPMTGIGGLLLKLNLSQQQSTAIAEKLNKLLEPVVTERALHSVPAMPELPPLTQRVPPVVTSSDSSKPLARNIIDLRKEQSTS